MFCVAILIAHASLGQQNVVDYNSLYKSLSSMKDYEAYWALFQYLQKTTSKDYSNSNAYYQVGLMMQKFMKESDPFLETANVQEFISHAIIYFSLSKRSLEEKEFRRHINFYPTVKPQGQRLTIQDVIIDTDERLNDVNEYKKNLNDSYSYLTKSVNNYNDCIKTFGEINLENNRLNDLYFMVDNDLKEKMNRLSTNFDSTLFYLDKFKASLENYPLGNYKINYTLRKIPVYRLYGLNSSDFLSKNVVLWDFRSWIQDFHHIMDTDIAFLYNSAQETNKTNRDHIANLLRMDTRGITPDYKINPLIVNKMLKYDFNSVTAALLSYQESKVKYLYSIADNKPSDDLVSFDRFTKSLDAFLNTVRHKQKTGELLIVANAKTTPESIEKYEQFFTNNYGGFDGYVKYLDNEIDENEAVMHNALNTYKDRVLKSYLHTGTEKLIFYKDEPIYLKLTTPTYMESANTGYYIHSKLQLSDKAMFIAGTRAVNKQKIAFTAVVDSIGGVKWLKEFRQANADTHAMLSALWNDGFVVVISQPAGNLVKNRILLLDAAGNTKSTKDLSFSTVPQKMVYDDIAQTYVLAFKGTSFVPYSVSYDPLHICMLNERLETVWSKSLEFDGYLSNVIKTDDNYFVYGAYNRLIDDAGIQYNLDANRVNMFVYPINAEGIWLNVNTFNASFSYYPLLVSKINNEYLDVIAVKNVRPDKIVEEKEISGDPYYLIIHSNKNVLYKNN